MTQPLDPVPADGAALLSLLEDSPLGWCALDGRGVITQANPAFCSMHGYAREELTGCSYSILLPDQDEDTFREEYARLISGAAPTRYTTLHRHKDATPLVVSCHVSFHTADQGHGVRSLVLVEDVTARNAELEGLRGNKRMLSDLLKNLPGFLYRCRNDEQWSEMFVSEGVAALTGYAAEEFMGAQEVLYNDLIHPDDQRHVWEAIQDAVDKKKPFQISYRLRTADGREKWVWERGHGIYDENGSPGHLQGFITDISELRNAQEELRREREFIRLVLDNDPSLIFVRDAQGRFLLVNRTLAALLGRRPVDFNGRTLGEMLPNQYEAEAFLEADRRVLEERLSLVRDESLTLADGRVIWLSTARTPLVLPTGEVHLLGISTDITSRRLGEQERLEMENALFEAQKLESLGMMAGGIAHDFNNLLQGILGSAELAQEELPAGHKAQDHLVNMLHSARRLEDLTRQMLAYTGRSSFVTERVDVNTMVMEMTRLLESALSRRSQMIFRLGTNLSPVRADPTQLRQVIMNLILNASEALGEGGGVIEISTGQSTETDSWGEADEDLDPLVMDYVWLKVSDNGCGMEEDVRSRVFEPFFSTKFTGRGLGLAAVQGIVRAHGGRIDVRSLPGEGSDFTIFIPALLGSSPDHPATTPEVAMPNAAGMILLADDEEVVRSIGTKILARLGFSVIVACDGAEAVELTETRSDGIACVIMDLTMPRLGGMDAMKRIKERRPDLPVILSSGYDAGEVMRTEGAAGFDGFLQKPYRVADMKAALARVLGSSGQEKP